ncbi:MAG: (2Fe-2S) ferredoxin domain-containing protein [Cyanobacteria bacterium SID2]|nr:(2Fe-2S) ferredoxin domain-containing protein [Cyanobacteria bacterium SID2]MBP0002552.1 (2Fe-2S) ferredoxin domain-containing protein [Cyanobacteria bacterium SBC]
MFETQKTPPWMFNLQGTVLGFLGKNPSKPKFIVLEVEEEQLAIKLPKQLRTTLRLHLQTGHRIRCIGRSQIDVKAGVIRLEAYHLFTLPPDAGNELSASPSAIPITTVAPSPCQHADALEHSSKPGKLRSKILVCQKSGCLKRGGHQLLVALEQALREHQLHESVEIRPSGCQKRCSQAPSLTIMPGKHRYDRLSPENLSALIEEHFCAP